MTGRRIVSIWLPRFAMERWQRWNAACGNAPTDDVPTVLVAEGPHGAVIHATNVAAEGAGVRNRARVVDMRAICPELRVEYANPAGDAAALGRLMLWARRWCPWTAVDGKDGLILDTTGSDHLFRGEAAMLAEIEGRLSVSGLTARLALAPSWGSAWALARHGGAVRPVCQPDTLVDCLAPLPVSALRLDAETVLLLRRLGLKTIGALAAVPRISLARRFSRAELPGNPLLRLDQAMGRLAEPVSSGEEPPIFLVRAPLAEPVQDPTHHLPALCEALCAQLSREGCGARNLRLSVYRTDGEVGLIDVATSAPSRDAAHLCRLFDGKLERLDPGFGFDLITLAAGVSEPLENVQARLGGGAEENVQLSRLIDRLTARLGASAVSRPVALESHLPERAERWTTAMAESDPSMHRIVKERPIRLLDHPEEINVIYSVPEGPPLQFLWRRQTHSVARHSGPERLAPEWWRDRPGARLRDYYKIEDQTGLRLWLYREGVHGDGRGGNPRWFVHGMFS